MDDYYFISIKTGNFFKSPVSIFHKLAVGTGFNNQFSANFSFYKLKPPGMKRETLEKLPLPKLCDLLVEKTILLLDSIDKRLMDSQFGT